jgi:hypothetical protein
MGTKSAVIHVNPYMRHQADYGNALKVGFIAHGFDAFISDSPTARADVHVCIGPHFALKHWRHGNTLLIDRAYWDDPLAVSVHWLKDGEKVRTQGNPYRDHPELLPMKDGNRTIYLCDYGDAPLNGFDTVRRHPTNTKPTETLKSALNRHDIALGRRTTALVTAAFMGLAVRTDDPHSPVYGLVDREQWAVDLAWHNWSKDEISSGDMLDAIGYDY